MHSQMVDLLKRVSFPVPFCSVCGGKYVDKFERHDNPITEEITLVAYCHGETSELKFSYFDINKVETEHAFSNPKFHQLNRRTMRKFNKKARDFW